MSTSHFPILLVSSETIDAVAKKTKRSPMHVFGLLRSCGATLKKEKVVFKDSVTGRFVTRAFAAEHPTTTYQTSL